MLSLEEPTKFEISPALMMVMTNLTYGEGFSLQEGETIDNYVGGVYVQVSHKAGTDPFKNDDVP